jgi:hypothetical protein
MNESRFTGHVSLLWAFLSVVVGYFHTVRVTISPCKTDSVLVVDPDTVLALPVSAQFLKPIPGRHGQVLKRQCRMQNVQFLQGLSIQPRRQAFAPAGLPKPFGVRIPEPGDHVL